jgi:ribosomal protein S18 acetylase RimI-like enzyme
VGLLSAYAFPDVASGGFLAYLYDIEVAESQRSFGIGRGLIEALLAACKADGVKLVWAGTEVENAAARRAFERTGAELEGDQYAEYEWDIA